MNTIKQLIEKYCPEGVEYKKLGEMGSFYSGLSGKSKDDFKDGNAKFITYMNVYTNPSTNLNITERVKIGPTEKQNKIEKGDVLFTGSSETPDECGMSSVVTEDIESDYYLNSFCFGYRINNKDVFDSGFLKHLFRDKKVRAKIAKTANGVTRFNVSKKLFGRISIPVPPIEVQREIVRILDNFTSLEAELEAELEARRKQYEYYRDQLLSFKHLSGGGRSEVVWKTLGEVAEIVGGRDYKQFNHGNIPVYGSGGIMTYIDTYAYDKPTVLLPRKGSISNVFYLDKPFWNVDTIFYTIIHEELLPKFFYYYICNYHIERLNTSNAARPALTRTVLYKIPIPVPPLSVQRRIVSILDRFESLVNDIMTGLPAEIAARRQQYEYYRDQLLTFKRKA